jgi:hypothetical protein
METVRNNNFSNTVYGTGIKRINSANPFGRTDILKNYSDDLVDKVWDTFSKYIAKNYQTGRGTVIPKFGTFTFTSPDVNLEGTTNQFNRDLKAKRPVFIVSSDFVERLKPGMYTKKGIVYYIQKQNNNIGHIKLNYAEIAYSLNVKKEECKTILDNYVKLIGDSLIKVL